MGNGAQGSGNGWHWSLRLWHKTAHTPQCLGKKTKPITHKMRPMEIQLADPVVVLIRNPKLSLEGPVSPAEMVGG